MPRKNKGNANLSDLDYLVLTSLIPEPRYGYAIRRDIMERTEELMKPSLATLYDMLHRLLSDGLIEKDKDEVIDGRVRRTYRITGLGQQAIAEKERILQLLNNRKVAGEV
jgi:DNA-binding PadR family transcriptional regulator